MKHIVLFASGSGSNAANLIRHFHGTKLARIAAVFCNNPAAGVIARAEALGVPVVLFTREELAGESVLLKLQTFRPDLIVLAGFLLKFPDHLIEAFPGVIVNIHPALLPKYGGKGMYGMHVHRAVLENNETETGITVHYVDGHYDNGDVIAQHRVNIADCASAEAIAEKVQALEQVHFPAIVERLLS